MDLGCKFSFRFQHLGSARRRVSGFRFQVSGRYLILELEFALELHLILAYGLKLIA